MTRGFFVDKYEVWSRRTLPPLLQHVTGGLLIGFPFSPIGVAASVLRRRGIPYVVDIGDPWALTASRPAVHGLALRRSCRMERAVWAAAVGAIVTTDEQATAIQALFPKLAIMVRPNGVEPALWPPGALSRRAQSDVLRLVHFGSLYDARIDVMPVLHRLVQTGPWNQVELRQFGEDWSGRLQTTAQVRVVCHPAVPWDRAISEAASSDAVIVIGNRDPGQLPSKVVSYLTLPRPRVAVVGSRGGSIDRYLVGKPGWLVLAPSDASPGEQLHRHLLTWDTEKLEVPESETWSSVANVAVDFALTRLGAAVGHDGS
jgi:hypothetical protein